MIKVETINEVQRLVRESPEKTCHTLSNGAVFAVRDGDMSCVTGSSQKQGDLEVDGVKYTVYLGGQK